VRNRGGIPEREAATRYDESHRRTDTGQAIDFLMGLCAGGRALELGVGTGRIALLLAGRGVSVYGMDASTAMLEQLTAADPQRTVTTMVGDFCDFALPERYDLIYCVYNAVFGLLTQRDQVQCFRSTARHLQPTGRFVLQCFVPRGDLGARIADVREDEYGLRVSTGQHDRSQQIVRTRQIYVGSNGTYSYDLTYRYVYPSEMDLMAELAGLELEARWADWARRPFDASASHHISVYRRPPTA
jgi:SAM-dependent methyltransferase